MVIRGAGGPKERRRVSGEGLALCARGGLLGEASLRGGPPKLRLQRSGQQR